MPQQPTPNTPQNFRSPYEFTRNPVTQRQWLTTRRVLFQDLGDHNYVVDVGGDIQRAIDNAFNQGGGIIRLGDGTHTPNTNLIIPAKTPIQILGVNMTTTRIDFGAGNYGFTDDGSTMYSTGTVSITNGLTVTGASTNWLSSGLVSGDEIFLDSRWYKIYLITGNTTIILAEGYGGSVLAGATYKAGKVLRDFEMNEISVGNSIAAAGAIAFDNCRNVLLEDITLSQNAKGIGITNFSEFATQKLISAAATGNGATFDTGTFCNLHQFASAGNGGVAFALTSVKNGSLIECAADGNTGDGINLTSCSTIDLIAAEANGNGGQGIELISGNSDVSMVNTRAAGNVSDGIKLTASSDYCKIIGSHFAFNGGYGVNIADSTCDDNHIAISTFNTNTSGRYNDSGTNTVLVGV